MFTILHASADRGGAVQTRGGVVLITAFTYGVSDVGCEVTFHSTCISSVNSQQTLGDDACSDCNMSLKLSYLDALLLDRKAS